MGSLADLRALAEQATPGPWHITPGFTRGVADARGLVTAVAEKTNRGPRDAAFIAACDPQTVLALVEVAEAAQAGEARLAWIEAQVDALTGNETRPEMAHLLGLIAGRAQAGREKLAEALAGLESGEPSGGEASVDYCEVVAAALALYEQVEMAESVGVCLPDRVPSLRLGAALAGLGITAEEPA